RAVQTRGRARRGGRRGGRRGDTGQPAAGRAGRSGEGDTQVQGSMEDRRTEAVGRAGAGEPATAGETRRGTGGDRRTRDHVRRRVLLLDLRRPAEVRAGERVRAGGEVAHLTRYAPARLALLPAVAHGDRAELARRLEERAVVDRVGQLDRGGAHRQREHTL